MVAIDRDVTNLMFALLRKIDQYGLNSGSVLAKHY